MGGVEDKDCGVRGTEDGIGLVHEANSQIGD